MRTWDKLFHHSTLPTEKRYLIPVKTGDTAEERAVKLRKDPSSAGTLLSWLFLKIIFIINRFYQS